MKKILILCMIVVFINVLFNVKKASAQQLSDYLSFSSINVSDGKMLRDYNQNEINEALRRTKKRKFKGWNYEIFQKNVPVSFISKTIFSIYNDGTTPIKYKVQVGQEETLKTSISKTGNLSYNLKGDIKKFRNGLDASIKIECSYSKTDLLKKQETLDLDIDPNTICLVYIKGEGLLTNGVARYYELWMTQEKGGFEYFVITNSYIRIEKIKL